MEKTKHRETEVRADGVRLAADLGVPRGALGTVIFAHGSGSSRRSPRNVEVARTLNDAAIATLLFDLLDASEATDRQKVFDIPLLGTRLVAATEWLRQQPEGALPVGYFGASTGAAAALWAAADVGTTVAAVVSRGGRPDLAAGRLGVVTSATMLIVGGLDQEVLRLNQEARAKMRCVTDLVVIPGAGHLFEEPGTLEAVADHAAAWFRTHLR